MSQVQPALQVLRPEQIEQVHAHSLEILERVGLRVESPRARDIFARGGCRLDGRTARFPADLVAQALVSAPRQIQLYDRRGEPAFCLGAPDQPAVFGIGVTNLYYQDPLTDVVEPFGRRHMALGARLANLLPEIQVVSTLGVVQDVPAESADLIATLEMVASTAKPLVLLVSDERAFPAVLDLLRHLTGDLAARPWVVPYFNPVSPLVLNAGTADKLLAAVDAGLPFIYSNYGMSGATTPITAAGTLAQLTAELLAGLVLSQLARPGAPVILGSLPATFDMREMLSFTSPQTTLLNLACAEMMAHYRLPHAGTSGSGNGWGLDLLTGDAFWLNHLTACLGKVGIAPFIGGNLDSLAFSPAAAVYADHIIRQARQFAAGFELSPALVGIDELAPAVAEGNFFAANLTLKLLRQSHRPDPIFPRLGLEQWQARGEPRAGDLLRQHTARLLAAASAPADRPELLARGEVWIAQHPVPAG